jgi:SIR2-like domain
LPQPLFVTTNYDQALERALSEAGEAADVVTYLSLGRDRGRFLHRSADGSMRVINSPNSYADVPLDQRPIVLKIHGEVDREPARDAESFVVSEDDYIAYLAETGIGGVLPVTLAARLRRSHFLFLGYGLLDWSFRVFLQRLWPDEQPGYRSWSVQSEASALERDFWRRRAVELIDAPLDEELERLGEHLRVRDLVAIG